MARIIVRGRLMCADDAQVALVSRLLPSHIDRTRAEPGCVSFVVEQTANPRVWRVDEVFVDSESFEAHRTRVRSSNWGRLTAAIRRDYTLLDGGDHLGEPGE